MRAVGRDRFRAPQQSITHQQNQSGISKPRDCSVMKIHDAQMKEFAERGHLDARRKFRIIFNAGEYRLRVALPTGTGKTIVFCELLKRMGVRFLCVQLLAEVGDFRLHLFNEFGVWFGGALSGQCPVHFVWIGG